MPLAAPFPVYDVDPFVQLSLQRRPEIPMVLGVVVTVACPQPCLDLLGVGTLDEQSGASVPEVASGNPAVSA